MSMKKLLLSLVIFLFFFSCEVPQTTEYPNVYDDYYYFPFAYPYSIYGYGYRPIPFRVPHQHYPQPKIPYVKPYTNSSNERPMVHVPINRPPQQPVRHENYRPQTPPRGRH